MNKHPFTYTVLRYVHDTGTGEFVNVGVVLCAPEARYARAILRKTHGRIANMFPSFNGDHFVKVIQYLQARFDELSADVAEGLNAPRLPQNALELASSVIALDDTAFQWSPMGSGLEEDLHDALKSIYKRMVMRHDAKLKTTLSNNETEKPEE